MSIEKHVHSGSNSKMTDIYVGDITLVFSYDELIGFAVPGVGRVRCENIWSPTTGRHLRSFPARYEDVPPVKFRRAVAELDRSLSGYGTRQGLISRLRRILAEHERR